MAIAKIQNRKPETQNANQRTRKPCNCSFKYKGNVEDITACEQSPDFFLCFDLRGRFTLNPKP